MTQPNTEPKPATDAQIAEWQTWDELRTSVAWPLMARIEQEREMRRELKTALVRLSCHPCRFYTGTWVVCKGEDTSKMCDMCAASVALSRAAKMEADNGE